jgi:hypothetical protein
MTRTWAPLELAAARLWSRRGRASLAALSALASSALLATMLAISLTVSDRTIARTIAGIPEAQRSLSATWGGLPAQEPTGGVATLDTIANRALTPLTGRAPSTFALYRETRFRNSLLDLAAGDNLGRWIRLRKGRLPRACTPARCEVVQVAGQGPLPSPFVRVGEGSLISQAPLGDLVGTATASSVIARAERFHRPAAPPFVVAEGTRRAGSLHALDYDYRSYRWIVPLKPADVHPWSLDVFGRKLADARATVASASGLFRLDAPEPEVRDAAGVGSAGRRRLLLLGGEAAALLLAFTVLVGSGFRRDAEASRRRLNWLGAARSQVALEASAEAAAIGGTGAAAGWFLGIVPALAVARHFGSPAGGVLAHSLLSAQGIALAVAVAVAAALVLLVTVRSPGVRLGSMRLSGLDLAATAAAAMIIVAFARGATHTAELTRDGGTGIVLLLLPALVAFVAAVLGARAVAALPRPLERVARRRSFPLRLAALSLARNPGRAAVAVAFLVVSVGLAVFATAYRSTLIGSQHDQARFTIPATAVVSEDYSKLVPVLRAAPLRAYRRLGRATPVIRLTGNVQAGQSFTLLALPAAAVASTEGWRGSFSEHSLDDLGRLIAPRRSVRLRTVAVPAGRMVLPARTNGLVRVRAVLALRDGSFRSVALPGRVPRSGLLGFSFDVTNSGLEREAISGEGAHPLGTLTLRLVRPEVDGRPLAVDFKAWRATGGAKAVTSARGATVRFIATSDVQPGFRVREPMDDRAVPVIASPVVADSAGVGGVLALEVEGTRVLGRVVGTATRFPSVNGAFVLADRQTLVTAMNSDNAGTAVTNEIWLGSEPPKGPPFDVLRVRTQRALAHRLESDPLARGSLLALGISALAGLGLALAGLLLVVITDLRDERGELFDLEAQGATPSSLRKHLRLRALIVILLGLTGGIATGAILGALVVSLVKVTANAGEPEPPLALSLDWTLLAAGLGAYLLLAAVLVSTATWRAFRAEEPGRFAEVGW